MVGQVLTRSWRTTVLIFSQKQFLKIINRKAGLNIHSEWVTWILVGTRERETESTRFLHTIYIFPTYTLSRAYLTPLDHNWQYGNSTKNLIREHKWQDTECDKKQDNYWNSSTKLRTRYPRKLSNAYFFNGKK